MPFITKKMLISALSNARRSVSAVDLEKYMRYKRDMERRLGMDDIESSSAGEQTVVGLPSSGSSSSSSAAAAAPTAAPRTFVEDDDEDDIYD